MDSTYDQIFAADPATPGNVAAYASVLIFAPGDETKTPLALKKVDGSVLSNPVQTSVNGFGPAFMAPLSRVAWEGGGFSGYFTSYDGIAAKADASAVASEASAGAAAGAAVSASDAAARADSAAEVAASAAASAAAEALAGSVAASQNAASQAAASAADAAAAANLVNAPADAAIATAIKGAGTQTAAALNATIVAKTSHGPRVVFDGDSITIGAIDAALQNRAASWTNVLAKASGGRILYIYNAAVSGQRSDNALARFDAYVAPQSPDTVVLTIGTNDIGQVIPLETFQANIAAYYNKVIGIGARLILGEIWPTSVSADRQTTTAAWSAWIRGWAAGKNVQVIPWQKLVDPLTSGWPTGWSDDGTHPVNPSEAATAIGLFGWESVKGLFGDPVVVRPVKTGLGLLDNGLFESVTGAIGVPTISTATASTATGTLPAGTYAYKVAARTFCGEGLPSVPVAAVLSGPGSITVSWNNTASNKGFHLYRKGPLDTDYRRIQTWDVSGTTTYTDNGVAMLGADIPRATDGSAMPASLVPGFNKRYLVGFGGRQESGIRGTVWRFTAMDDGTASAATFATSAIAPGEKITISGLIAGLGAGTVNWQWRSAGGTLTTIRLSGDNLTTEFGRFFLTMTAPANTTYGRISLEAPAGTYLDVAEMLVER